MGTHQANTAVPQAFIVGQAGARGLTAETDAGQWATSFAMACSLFDQESQVFVVRVSCDQKPWRLVIMQGYGTTITPSPSPRTAYGRKVPAEDPFGPGSLGIAISEFVEAAVGTRSQDKYSLGSVLGPVLMPQTVVGPEALQQFELGACESYQPGQLEDDAYTEEETSHAMARLPQVADASSD